MIQSVARPGEKQVFVQGDVTKMLTRLLIGIFLSVCVCVCVCVCEHACIGMYYVHV